MKKWLTEDPLGRIILTLITSVLTTVVAETAKAKLPVWPHLVSGAVGLSIALPLLSTGSHMVLMAALAALGFLAPFFYPLLTVGWQWLAESHSVFGWGLILVLISVPGLVLAVTAVYQLIDRTPLRDPLGPRNYRSDHIFDAAWFWEWNNDDIIRLNAFCPNSHCQNQLELAGHAHRNPGSLYCDRCGFRTLMPGGEAYWQAVRSRVQKEIRRRINTGEYKQVLERLNKGE